VPSARRRIGKRGKPDGAASDRAMRPRSLVAAHPELAAKGCGRDRGDPARPGQGAGPAAREARRQGALIKEDRGGVIAGILIGGEFLKDLDDWAPGRGPGASTCVVPRDDPRDAFL